MAAIPWEADLPSQLKTGFAGRIVAASTYPGQNKHIVKSDTVIEVLEYLELEVDSGFRAALTARISLTERLNTQFRTPAR